MSFSSTWMISKATENTKLKGQETRPYCLPVFVGLNFLSGIYSCSFCKTVLSVFPAQPPEESGFERQALDSDLWIAVGKFGRCRRKKYILIKPLYCHCLPVN